MGPGRVGRVAAETRNTHDSVVGVVVRLQFLVGQWPVIGHSVQGLDAKVRWVKPWEMGTPVNGAATNRVVHQWRYCRLQVVHRIILRQPPDVGVWIEVGLAVDLVVQVLCGIGRGVQPTALLQADYLNPGLAKAPGNGGAGGTRADNQYVRHIVWLRHDLLW